MRVCRKSKLPCIVFAAVLLMLSSASAQMCGDVNGDAGIDIRDITALVYGLYYGGVMDCKADVDGYDKVSLRDVVFEADHLFVGFASIQPCCPAQAGELVPITNPNTYLAQSTDLFPAGQTTVNMKVALSSGYDWVALVGKYRCRVGTDAPQISNVVYNYDDFVSAYGGGSAEPSTAEDDPDVIMIVGGLRMGAAMVAAGKYTFISFDITAPVSAADRTISFTNIDEPHTPRLVSGGTNYLPVVEFGMTFTDTDGDHIDDFYDNCPLIPNFSQADGDLDGIGDACDPDADSCAGQLIGDLNGDLQIDNSDLTYFVNYLLNGGPPPIYLSNADVDGDCDIDTGDLRHFTDWLYGIGSFELVDCTCQPSNIRTYCCLIRRGNVNADPEDKCNIADVTYITEYLFGIPNGPAPICWEEADVNADGEFKINISDVTYLVDYLFGLPNGPEPQLCPY